MMQVSEVLQIIADSPELSVICNDNDMNLEDTQIALNQLACMAWFNIYSNVALENGVIH